MHQIHLCALFDHSAGPVFISWAMTVHFGQPYIWLIILSLQVRGVLLPLGKSDLPNMSYFAYLVPLKSGYSALKGHRHRQGNRRALEDGRVFSYLTQKHGHLHFTRLCSVLSGSYGSSCLVRMKGGGRRGGWEALQRAEQQGGKALLGAVAEWSPCGVMAAGAQKTEMGDV